MAVKMHVFSLFSELIFKIIIYYADNILLDLQHRDICVIYLPTTAQSSFGTSYVGLQKLLQIVKVIIITMYVWVCNINRYNI